MTITDPQRILLDQMLIKAMNDTKKRMATSFGARLAEHPATLEEVASEVDGMYFALVHHYLKHEAVTTFSDLEKNEQVDPYIIDAARKFAKTARLTDAETIACIGDYLEDLPGMKGCTQKDFATKYTEIGGRGI